MITDGLTNILTGLGDPSRDKLAGAGYASATEYDDQVWQNMYRDSFLARALIDNRAEDATREWREWQADAPQISALEADEARLGIQGKLKEVTRLARLYGVAHLYFDLGDDQSQPVNLNAIEKGGVRFCTVLSKREVSDGITQDDPMLDGYGMPSYYDVSSASSGMVRVHPSRMVTIYGDMRPSDAVFGVKADSVLRKAKYAITQHDFIRHHVAALVAEAKVDVWRIPDLSRILSDPEGEAAFLKAAQMSNLMKGVNGTVYMDAGNGEQKTEYTQKSASFATLPDIIAKAEDQICAAFDGHSKMYVFGASAGGLSSGATSLEMDYAKVTTYQKTVIQPAMSVLDECLIRSALGSRPEEVHYNWRSLWSMSDAERAKIALDTASAFGKMVNTGELPAGVLTHPMINTMTEIGGIRGLEAAYQDWESAGGRDDLSQDVAP